MTLKKLVVFTIFSGNICAQSPEFDAKGILYFQDSDFNVSTLTNQRVIKSGTDLVGAFTLPLRYSESQNPSEQAISNSASNNHRMFALRSDKKTAYILETRGSLPKSNKEVPYVEVPAGSYVSVLHISNLSNLRPEYRFPVAENPTALALDPSNKYLAVSSQSIVSGIQIYELDDMGKPLRMLPAVSFLDAGAVNDIFWHPNKDFLIYIKKEAKEVGLVKVVKDKAAIIRLEQFGEVIKFDGNPVSGIFSKDGKNLFVLDQGDKNTGSTGKVFQIKISLSSNEEHALLSKVDVEENPTNISLHPGGEYLMVTNSKRSSSNATFGQSSLSVIFIKNTTLETKLTFALEGVCPTQVRFDRSGKNFAIGYFQSKAFGKPTGAVSFYKFTTGNTPRVDKQDGNVNVSSGLHFLEVVN